MAGESKNTKLSRRAILLAMVPALPLAGCGGGGGGSSGGAPAAGLELDAVAAIVEPEAAAGTFAMAFSSPLDPQSVNAETITVVDEDDVRVPGTLQVDGAARRVRFTPERPLGVLATLQVRLGTGLRDASGRSLASPVVTEVQARDGQVDLQREFTLPTGPQDFSMSCVLDRAGNAMIVFLRRNVATDNFDIYAFRYVAGTQAWSGPQLLHEGPGDDAMDLSGARIVADQDGNAMLGWLQRPPPFLSEEAYVHARRFDAVNGWEATSVISLPGKAALEFTFAPDPSGDFTAIWLQRERNFGGPLIGLMSRRYHRATGHWDPEHVLVHDEADSLKTTGPEAAVDPAGNITLTWFRDPGPGGRIMATHFDALTGRWADASTTLDLVGPAADAGQAPRLGIGRDGTVIAAWFVSRADEPNGVFREVRVAMQARRSSPGAPTVWSAPVTLSIDPAQLLRNLVCGVDDRGGAVVMWISDKEVAGVPTARLMLRRWSPASQAWGPDEVVPATIPADPLASAGLMVHGRGHLLILHRHNGHVVSPASLSYSRYDAGLRQWTRIQVPMVQDHGLQVDRLIAATNVLGHLMLVWTQGAFSGNFFR